MNYKKVEKRFINYAHRGASSYEIENTKSAFDLAIEMNANGIEFDIQKSKDDVLIIYHDDTLKKCGKDGCVSDYTVEEIKKMKITLEIEGKVKSEKILTFEEFLEMYANKELTFAIELKAFDIEKQVYELCGKYKILDKTIFTSFEYENLVKLRNIDNDIRLGYLVGFEKENILEKLININAYQVCLNINEASKELVELYNCNGFGTRAWGVKNEEFMKKAIEIGFTDGMTVNFPDKLSEYIETFKKRKCVYVIMTREEDNKIAIIKNDENLHFFIGGGIEENEDKIEALKREVLEETGYSIKNLVYFQNINSLSKHAEKGRINVEAEIYIAQFDNKEREKIELDHNVVWINPEEYKKYLNSKYQKIVVSKYNNIFKYKIATTIRNFGNDKSLKSFEKGIEILEESIFKTANLNFHDIKEILYDCEDEIIKMVKKSKLDYVMAHAPIHFPFFFNEYNKLEEKESYEKRILKSIEVCSKVEIQDIVVHIGTYLDQNGKYLMQESIEHNIKYLEKFVEFASNNNLKILIENGTNQVNDITPTVDELIKIVDYFNQLYKKEVVGICYDFGHANLNKSDMVSDLLKIKSRLKGIHVHDNNGKDDHKNPYEGNINWNNIIKTLDKIEYKGAITSEVKYPGNSFNILEINKTFEVLMLNK